MKTYYKNDLNKVYLIIEGGKEAEDYRIPMLKQNQIPGVVETDVRYMDGIRQFYYDISGKTSLQQTYEKTNLGYEEIKRLVEELLQTIRNLKKYMLDGKGILLEPEFIFCEKNHHFFCYYPDNDIELSQAFHELTEYMVREVDYRDEKGVHLAYVLHKATMEEHYSIEQIMKEFFEEREEMQEEVSYEKCEEGAFEKEMLVEEKRSVWDSVRRLIRNHLL